MKKLFPHILGAIFVLIIIGAWMLIAHLVKKPLGQETERYASTVCGST